MLRFQGVCVSRDSSALLGVSWLIYKFFLFCWFCVCPLLLSHQYFFNVGGCIHIIIRLERLIILVSVDIRHHVACLPTVNSIMTELL